ncbi:hypothetical protein [Nocardioides sp. AX2bis]|uniref:hypothetical protein n=1 Tax=Nocardioides sp. AX2bis TaxID=2653157 RepID=UPI0013594199|nr:hypothetical protein [Nocardioides sp. AX2bis]
MTRPQRRTARPARPTTGPGSARERGASDAQQAVAVLLIVALGAVAAAVLQHL